MKKVRRPQLKLTELEKAFSDPEFLSASHARSQARRRKYAQALLWYLDQGQVRVWDPSSDHVHTWVKQAILTYFSHEPAAALNAGCFEYWDKLRIKSRAALKGVRVIPGGIARYGSFLEAGTILMPGFVNIGAYVGSGTMVDTWATVGSCAQIGKNVHLSGGVGIGGVLEPAQAAPVIVEDGAFLGSRCIVVEGVRIGKEAVLGAGVTLTASTKIIDVRGNAPIMTQGRIPDRAVVIPGTQMKKFSAGEFGVPCALIIGDRKPSTDLKTSLNAALRDHAVAV